MSMRMGVGIAVVLLAVWVIAFVVMKVTSAAIHLLVLAAVVFAVMHLVSRFRGRGHTDVR
jgi:hypothetical protein